MGSVNMRAHAQEIITNIYEGKNPISCIRDSTPTQASILEIGGCTNPWFRKCDFTHLKTTDWLSRDDLAASYNVPRDLIDDVDYICGDSRLTEYIPEYVHFDLIVSSHNIEHQPDIVSHLRSTADVLYDDGLIIFGVPDKRATYDVYRPHTVTSDAVIAFQEGRKAISPRSLFDFLSKITADRRPPVDIQDRSMEFKGDVVRAHAEFIKYLNTGDTEFRGAHNWVFTPASLGILVTELYMIGLTKLMPVWISPRLGNTILCFLEKRAMPFSELSESDAQSIQDSLLESYRALTFDGG